MVLQIDYHVQCIFYKIKLFMFHKSNQQWLIAKFPLNFN